MAPKFGGIQSTEPDEHRRFFALFIKVRCDLKMGGEEVAPMKKRGRKSTSEHFLQNGKLKSLI